MSDSQSLDPTQAFLHSLPEIRPDEEFWFACHPGISCFNACCSDLTMPLTPYDVVRLCKGLEMGSEQFMEEFAIPGCYDDTGFPLLHLRMDPGASKPCPFVTAQGCGVYEHRSSACRTYPLGRATRPQTAHPPCAYTKADQSCSPSRDQSEEMVEQYFLVREGHCMGFDENKAWTTESWLKDQGIEVYNRMNDRYMRLMARFKVLANGSVLSDKHATMALLCLYQQDRFLDFIRQVNLFQRVDCIGEYAQIPREELIHRVTSDPEERLLFAFEWIELVLFGAARNLQPKSTGS